MHKAYQLSEIDVSGHGSVDRYFQHGQKLLSSLETLVKREIQSYFGSDGRLEANKIMGDWFPEVQADIFLSHSHADESHVLALAGLLDQELGIKCFIDSTVWGYSNELLLNFDKEFCMNKDKTIYYYDKRNITTTHVHLMLNMALMSMMDKTEAVFFCKTPNAVYLNKNMDMATSSPWIFSEISMTRALRIKTREDHRIVIKANNLICESLESYSEVPEVEYPMNLNHLPALGKEEISKWISESKKNNLRGKDALDYLFDMRVV